MGLKRSGPLKRRTPMERTGGNLKRTRLAPRSAKREAEADSRKIVRQVTLHRAGHRCQAIGLIPGHVCRFTDQRPGLEVHERIPRSLYPGGHLDPTNTLALCPDAHDWVDANQDHAHELGLHGRSWERPGYLPPGAHHPDNLSPDRHPILKEYPDA